MDLSRRDLLVGLLQALFLALFPWLRNARGAEVVRAAVSDALGPDLYDDEEVKQVVDQAIFKAGTFNISIGIKGFELSPAMYAKIQGMKQIATVGSEVES